MPQLHQSMCILQSRRSTASFSMIQNHPPRCRSLKHTCGDMRPSLGTVFLVAVLDGRDLMGLSWKQQLREMNKLLTTSGRRPCPVHFPQFVMFQRWDLQRSELDVLDSKRKLRMRDNSRDFQNFFLSSISSFRLPLCAAVFSLVRGCFKIHVFCR